MTVEPMTDAELDRWEQFAPPPDKAVGICRDVMSMLARIRHERSRADAAEAERDAAVARAIPKPRLMRTVEEVEALAAGLYLVRPRWDTETWMLAKRRPTRTWSILVGDGAAGVMDDNLVGAWIAGPLPTPTAAQEATDAQ